MSRDIPANIVKEYGSARAFKADKRRLLHAIRKLANEFFTGSSYIPDEAKEASRELRNNLTILEDQCSERKWGR
jgi:hypothetical protein